MNPECNKRLLRDFYEEVLCGRNLEAAPRFLHDDYVQHNPHAAQGIAGFQEFHRGFFSAIPDARVTVNMMAAEGDLRSSMALTPAPTPARAFSTCHPPGTGCATMSSTSSGYGR